MAHYYIEHFDQYHNRQLILVNDAPPQGYPDGAVVPESEVAPALLAQLTNSPTDTNSDDDGNTQAPPPPPTTKQQSATLAQIGSGPQVATPTTTTSTPQ